MHFLPRCVPRWSRQWQILQPTSSTKIFPGRDASKSFFLSGHKGSPICIKYLCLLCRLVSFIFLTFWGTLPCGSHLLIYVSPKRRKLKAKCVIIVPISWKNLMQCCGKIIEHVSEVGNTTTNVVLAKKITSEKINVVFCAVSYVVISQLLNVYMLSCFRK